MQMEILLFDGFDELDVFGPFEILAPAGPRLVTLDGAREVRSDRGIVVRAQAALSDAPDVVVVPGGGWLDRAPQGAYAEVRRGVLPSAIAERRRLGTTVASVCTGALILAHAGVLDGRRATTNPQALDDLRAFPDVEVVEARVVEDGDVLTAGAPSCGLDLGLALLARAGGPELVAAAEREVQWIRPRETPGAPRTGRRSSTAA